MLRSRSRLAARPGPSKDGHPPARPGGPARARTRGSAPLRLAVLLLLLTGAVLAVLLGLFGAGRGGSPPPAAAAREPSRPGRVPAAPELAAPEEAPRPAPGEPAPAPTARPGTGTLRGSVSVPAGADFPSEWFLEIEPSKSLVGREFAEARLLRFGRDERRFAVDDLPLAGYDVRASAPGMNGVTVPVLLDSADAGPFVALLLRPAGDADGFVLDERGRGVEGARVTLETLPAGPEHEARTDEAGQYRFLSLPDGRYRLTVGHAERPIVPAREVDFRAPSARFPDVVVPVLSAIRVRVVDEAERPVEGIRVRGLGRDGGYFEAATDAEGLAWGRFLPAGSYKVYADGEAGRGKATLELGPAQETRLEIRVSR